MSNLVSLPAPGLYLSCKRFGSLPAVYMRVIGPSACGGPYFDAVFNVTGNSKRLSVRVAVDGSFRDARTFLPINCYGEIFE